MVVVKSGQVCTICPFTATTRSPLRKPARSAGEPVWIEASVVFKRRAVIPNQPLRLATASASGVPAASMVRVVWLPLASRTAT